MTKPILCGLAVMVLILWNVDTLTAGNAMSPTKPMACTNTVSTFPYLESFEVNLGLWENTNSVSNDWTRETGPTDSGGTGPSGAADGNYYIYTEATGHFSTTAILESPCFDLTGENEAYFEFKYNMNGPHMGTLKLELSTNSGSTWPTELWSLSGNQEDYWNTVIIDLSSYTGQTIKLRFYGAVGSNWQSDMAVDDIILSNQSLQDSLSCDSTITSFPYQESFESGLGEWKNVMYDDTSWTIDASGTPSSNTGPSSAADGTYYLYVESSWPNYPAKEVIIESPCFDLTNASEAQFDFKYHMYGAAMGTLKLDVFSEPENAWTTLWSKTGDQGNQWYQAQVDLTGYAGKVIKLRFFGITGTLYTSDMAIDDVELSLTAVSSSPACATTVQTFPYEQSFENSWAGWTESHSNDIWRRNSGTTTSGGTGPDAAIDGDYYMYAEGTFNMGDTAYLNSPCFDLTLHNSAAFRFFYNMHDASGMEMGNLNLQISTNNGSSWTNLWTKSGDQGDEWHWASVDLGNYLGQVIQLRFYAKLGTAYRSDMAVDGFYLDTDLSQSSGTLFGGAYFPSSSTCEEDDLSGTAVENIYVMLENHGDGSLDTFDTDINGDYSGFVEAGDISLTANAYSTNWTNGVSTFDLIKYTQHIDDINHISCPLFRLAADVNSDGEIDTLDKNLVNSLILSTISSFPDAPNWRLIPMAYMRGTNDSPDPSHAADFWNNAKEDLDGNDYPFKAQLDFNQKSYTYDGSESWLQELDHWTYDSLVSCQQGTFDFYLVKSGDISGNASTSSFTAPPSPLRQAARGKDRIANQNYTVLYPKPAGQAAGPSEKAGNKKYEIKIIASTPSRIDGYQLGIQFDDEVLELGKIKPNREDLKQSEAKNFGQARKTFRGGTMKTLWVNDFKTDRRGKEFGQNLELFSFEFKSKASLTQVRSAFRLDNGVWETAFFGRDGKVNDVDVQIVVEEIK